MKKYVSKEDGSRLGIVPTTAGRFMICWDCEDNAVCLGQYCYDEAQDIAQWEAKCSEEAVAPFADAWVPSSMNVGAYLFNTEERAQQALKAANQGLLRGRKAVPWPEWALTARANGWKPPKGWEP